MLVATLKAVIASRGSVVSNKIIIKSLQVSILDITVLRETDIILRTRENKRFKLCKVYVMDE